ncbi:hypothetical protein KKC13_07895 [bacterium]|nr:hypothetical protein [bacterium]MBU1959075.1 hypothetical protein [bacterium]
MKKITLSVIAFSLISTASEIEYGTGTFSMKGGFLGLTGSIGTDVSTYSLLERHSNLSSSNFFYGYDFTWYDSETLKQAQHTYNNITSTANNFSSRFLPNTLNVYAKIPSMNYRAKGLDANIKVGYDVLHEDQDNFVGLGLLVGLSMPWIDSSTDAAPDFSFVLDNSGNILNAADYFKSSKTSLMSYKIGPSVTFQKSLNEKVSVYGTGSFAYQTGSIENDYSNSKFSVNGTFQEYNIGFYFSPFTEEYQWGWLRLSPRIYGTLGYKYSKWDLDEMVINMSGAELSSDILDPLGMKFGMDSSISYVGIGYSF